MTARLAASVLAKALLRLAEQQGGFGTVLFKGDETAGPILVQALQKGQFSGLFERHLDASGHYAWGPAGPQDIESVDAIGHYLERRRRNDPDLWVIELDIPDAPRFIAETLAAT